MAQLGFPHSYIGVATAFVNTCRSVGGALATTIYTTILENYVKDHVATNIATAALQAGLPSQSVPYLVEAIVAENQTALISIPGITPAIIGAASITSKETLVRGFRLVYLVSLAFGGVGVIASLLSRNVDKFKTKEIEITVGRQGLLTHEDEEQAPISDTAERS
jgi:hypothetical protein